MAGRFRNVFRRQMTAASSAAQVGAKAIAMTGRALVLAAVLVLAAFPALLGTSVVQAAPGDKPPVAIVMSANTGNFYGSGYNDSIKQLQSMLQDAGVSYKMVFNRGVESGALAGYRLVILPLDACMSAKEVEQIRAYVRSGGKILAAYETGNHSETGASLPDFQIGDLLGVRLVRWDTGTPKYSCIHFRDAADPLAKRLPSFIPAPRHTTEVVEPLAGSRVVADWYNDDQATSSGAPAVVTTDHSVYFADNIFDPTVALNPAIRRMVLNAVASLAPDVVDVEKGARAALQALDQRLAAVAQALQDARYLDIADSVLAEAQKSLDAARTLRQQAQTLLDQGKFDDAQGMAQDAAPQAAAIPNSLVESNPVEARALWVDNTHMPNSPAAVAQMMDRLQRIGFNMVFAEVFAGGYTLWPSQVAASYGIAKQRPGYEAFDPLQALVTEAHKRGIALIAWFDVFMAGFNGPGPICSKYPQWQEIMEGGRPLDQNNFAWLSPAVPEARRYLLELFAEVVRNYDVDGIQLDYIRYSSTPSGYCPSSLQRFQKETGLDARTLTAEKDPQGWQKWIHWRANLVTTFVAEVAQQTRALRPGVTISADVGPGYRPEGDFPGTLQDWPTWVEQGYLDYVCPMVYRDSAAGMRAALDMMNGYLSVPALVYPGLQIWQVPQPSDLVSQITEARKDSLGVAIFAWPYLRPELDQALKDGPFRTLALNPLPDLLRAAGVVLGHTVNLLELYRSRGLVQPGVLDDLAGRLRAIASQVRMGVGGAAPDVTAAPDLSVNRLSALGRASDALFLLGAAQQQLADWQAAGQLDPRAAARIGKDLSQARLLITLALR